MSELLQAQDGVVSRRQLSRTGGHRQRHRAQAAPPGVGPRPSAGCTSSTPVRSRGCSALGRPSSSTRPAALAGPSACAPPTSAVTVSRTAAPIRVCVDSSRTMRSRPGITVVRLGGWASKTQEHLSPPRQRLEHALVAAAAAKTREDAAVALPRRRRPAGPDHRLGDWPPRSRSVARLKHRRLLLEILR